MTFRGNFLIEIFISIGWVVMNLAFYVLIFHYTPTIGEGTGWGKYQFFVFFATGLLVNSLVQTLFMTNADELSDLIRTGDAGLRAAEADRHPVPRLAAADRLVVAGQFRAWGWRCWRMRWSSCTICRPGGSRALSALRRLRRGDLLQPDDRPGGGERVAGAEPDALRLLVLHHQLFPLPDGDLPRPAGARRCGGCSRSCIRC